MPATTANKARVQAQLEAVSPLGGTDHMFALRDALKLKPEVIFFLTDADLMSNGDVDEILTEVGPTRIQAAGVRTRHPAGRTHSAGPLGQYDRWHLPLHRREPIPQIGCGFLTLRCSQG